MPGGRASRLAAACLCVTARGRIEPQRTPHPASNLFTTRLTPRLKHQQTTRIARAGRCYSAAALPSLTLHYDDDDGVKGVTSRLTFNTC